MRPSSDSVGRLSSRLPFFLSGIIFLMALFLVLSVAAPNIPSHAFNSHPHAGVLIMQARAKNIPENSILSIASENICRSDCENISLFKGSLLIWILNILVHLRKYSITYTTYFLYVRLFSWTWDQLGVIFLFVYCICVYVYMADWAHITTVHIYSTGNLLCITFIT